MLTHRKAESLADNVVEGHSEEVASEEKQTEPVNSVKLAPLRFLLEKFVNLYRLPPLSHLDRQSLFFPLDIEVSFLIFIVDRLNAF